MNKIDTLPLRPWILDLLEWLFLNLVQNRPEKTKVLVDDSKAHDDLEVMWTQTESLSPVRAGSSEKCRRLQTHIQFPIFN